MLGNSNITLDAVREELGLNQRMLGKICSSSKINKWSYWKPIVLNVESVTSTSFIAAKYGFKTNFSLADLRDYILTNGTQYTDTYSRPLINDRLGDFRNYEHEALPPYGNPSKLTITQEGSIKYWNISLEALQQPNGSITANQLRQIQMQHVNVMLIRFGGSEDDEVVGCYGTTGDNKTFKINANNLPNGAYYLTFYFSSTVDNVSAPTESFLTTKYVIPIDNCLITYIYERGYDLDIYWFKTSNEFYNGLKDFQDNSTTHYNLIQSNPQTSLNQLPPNYSLRIIFSGYPSAWYGEGKVASFIVNDIDGDEIIVGFSIVGGSLINGFFAAYTNDLLDGRGCFFEDIFTDEDDYIPIDESGQQKYIIQLNSHGYNRFDLVFGEVSYNQGDFIWNPTISPLYNISISNFPQLNPHTSFKLWKGEESYLTDYEVYGMDNEIHLFELKSNIN